MNNKEDPTIESILDFNKRERERERERERWIV